MYLESGGPVFSALMRTAGGMYSWPETQARRTSSNQALPVASPQPPKRQWTSRASLAPASNSTATWVQSCVPVTGDVCQAGKPSTAMSAPFDFPGTRSSVRTQPLSR